MNSNFQNSKRLENIYSVNQINESNIPLNPRTYDTIKQQICINSEFRKKSLISIEDRLTVQRSCCDDETKSNTDESSSNFIIELSESIDNVVSLELVSAEIPIILDTFSKSKQNSTFVIRIFSRLATETTNSLHTFCINIPDGIWIAADIDDFLNDQYFDISNNIDISNNHLSYLTANIASHHGKLEIRFKTRTEISEFNQTNSTNLLEDLSGQGFYYELFNCQNIPYKNYVYETIDNSCCQTVKCDNRVKFIQGFTDAYSSITDDYFKFTTLGTFGFSEEQIYQLSGNILKPRKIHFSDISYNYNYGLTLYNGYIKAANIYGTAMDSAVYIRVNDFVGNRGEQIKLTGRNKTQITANVLARTAFKIGTFQNNVYNSVQDYSIKRNYFGGVKISKLQIQILDKYGRIIDLKNYPTNFVFEFTQEYSSERLSNFRNRM